MIRKEGKVYEAVVDCMRARGCATEGLEVATLGRGVDHIVLRKGEVIGGYNHASKRLYLNEDIIEDHSTKQ